MGLVAAVTMSSPLGASGVGATPALAVIVRAMTTGRSAAASLAPAERQVAPRERVLFIGDNSMQ